MTARKLEKHISLGQRKQPPLKVLREENQSLTSTKESQNIFYKVENHQELFKIGSSFFEDYINGIKSFAITSTGYQLSQQKVVMGIASFFEHKSDVKIAIISDSLFNGFFKSFVVDSTFEEVNIYGTNESYGVHSFHGHFDFIDLQNFTLNVDVQNTEKKLVDISENYDVIFWDVPHLEKIKESSQIYFPIISRFESLSIVVAKDISTDQDVTELKQFFIGYGINLKGLLFDSSSKETEKPKSIWDRIFRK